MHQVTSCGVLVVRGEPIESLLLMKHAHRYDLPKGHLDAGETEIEGALRELWEETGITRDDISLDPVFRFELQYLVPHHRDVGGPARKTLIVFLGRLLREVAITPTEHAGFVWLPWRPPVKVQPQTIDPLLAHLERHLYGRRVPR